MNTNINLNLNPKDFKKYYIPVIDCIPKDIINYEPYIEKDAKRLNDKGIGCILVFTVNPTEYKKPKKTKDKWVYVLMREEQGDEIAYASNGDEMSMKGKFHYFKKVFDDERTEILRTWEIDK